MTRVPDAASSYPLAVSTPPNPAAKIATFLPAALLSGVGALLAWRAQILGASPWHLQTLPALLGAGAIGAALLPIRVPRWAVISAGAVGASLLLAHAFLPPTAVALGTLLSLWALARTGCSAPAPHPAAWLLAPLGLVAGALLPAGGLVLGAGALLLSADAAPSPALPRRVWIALPMALGAGGALAAALGAARALDPTPASTALFLGSALLAGAMAAQFTRKRDPRPLWLATIVLAAWVLLLSLPYRFQVWVEPLAGARDPRWILAGLVAAPGAVLGLGAGAAMGPLQRHPGGSALGVGALALGLGLGSLIPEQLPGVLVGVGGLAVLAGVLMPAPVSLRVAAPVVGTGLLLVWFLLPWNPADWTRLGVDHLRDSPGPEREHARMEKGQVGAQGWDPNGAWALEVEDGAPTRLVVEGARIPRGGRGADTRLLMPHLAAGLARRADSAVVLGESFGELSAGLLAQECSRVVVAVPQPLRTRAVAGELPGVESAWLHPALRLERGSAEEVLRAQDPVDVIVEVAERPWRDAAGGLPTPAGLRLRRQHLTEGGVYLLSVPVTWMTEPELRGLLGEFAEHFEASRAFLPAQGADQLIVAGFADGAPRSWDRMVEASVRGGALLGTLDIQSPVDLADRSLASAEALATGGTPPVRLHLGATLHRKPSMLLPLFAEHLDGSDWLDTRSQAQAAEALDARQETNKVFLECLDSAARGELQDSFQSCRSLSRSEGGEQRLDPLIGPQLERGRKAAAAGDGQACMAQVEQARLINPRSAETYALAGRCRMILGDPRSAREEFDKALELDAGNLDALLGLAQLSVRRGEDRAALDLMAQAAHRNPRSWRPPYYRGMLLMDLGELEDAEAQLANARGLAGDQSTAPLAALAHLALLQGQAQQALPQARLAADREPNARNLHLVGWAYLELGSPDAARPFLERAILEDPEFLPAHGDLGRVLAAQGQYGMAVQSFDRVLALEPSNAGAILNRQRAIALLEQEQQQAGAPTAQ